MFENYEGTAIDTSEFVEEVQSETEPVQTETIETVEPQETGGIAEETVIPVEETPEKINVPGVGEFTADEIREFRQGSLRQSDYTRKTQDLARQREQLKDAEDLYNYLKSNPHLVQVLKTAEQNPNSVVHNAVPSPENVMLKQLMYNQKALETDIKMSALKDKYGDVDEVAIYQKAAELKTDDFEFVYKAIQYDNLQGIDERALVEIAKEELRAELEANKAGVSTVINTQQTQPIADMNTLTDEQRRVAEAMGMSAEEYKKWMG